MPRLELAHRTGECAGRWESALRLWGRRWRCSRCGAVYAESQRVIAAVSADYASAHLLEKLADEGRTLLGR
jgi:tRNA(Ile2) C34 agmatinyltransferase TiaS